MGDQLALDAKLEGLAQGGCSLLQGALLEWRNDKYIKRRRTYIYQRALRKSWAQGRGSPSRVPELQT